MIRDEARRGAFAATPHFSEVPLVEPPVEPSVEPPVEPPVELPVEPPHVPATVFF